MTAIFRYPGGKSKSSVREKIHKYFPEKYSEFRVPMVGGGGIFFSVRKDVKRWINDIDTNLISVYKALQDRPEEFIAKCREIGVPQPDEVTDKIEGGKKVYNARMKAIFDQFSNDENMDRALRYYYINRTGWAGRVNYKRKSRLYFSNPEGWNIIKTRKLEMATEILKGVEVTNYDASVLLNADGKNVFIYLDPPYKVNTDLAETSQLYTHNFTDEDHITLAGYVKECKHKVLISYDDDVEGFIRDLYREEDGFYTFAEEWTYCGTSNNKKQVGKELIITNYPVELRIDLFA